MKKICENNSIIIVSGRSHSDIKKIISSNNIKKSILPLIICRNGQEISDINNENIIYEEYMQFNMIKKVIETLEENNVEDRLIEEKQVQVIEKESEVEKYLKTIDPMALSPLDALSTLIELKKLVK